MFYYKNIGYKEKCKDVPVLFPPQHQDTQPGIENIMDPLPIFDDPNYIGTGKLKDKVAIVTGGDSGIGRAVALGFAKEGANISIVYYDEHEDAKITKELIENQGVKCILISGDISKADFCKCAIEKTIDIFNRLDILVNNAGVQFPQKNIEDLTDEQFSITFHINIFSVFYMTKYSLPYLKSGSSIISTSSLFAYRGCKELLDYSSTKGAIVSFTRAVARSLAEKNIRVNAVAPGLIWTPLAVSSWSADEIPTYGTDNPMKRPAQPVELAPTYVYLASDDSSYVTGQILHVDGGQSMQS